MREFKRIAALVGVIGLVASACVGGNDDSEASNPTQLTTEPAAAVSVRIEAATDGLVQRFGGKEAFALVVVSVDQGYTVNQVLDDFSAMGTGGRLEGLEPAGSPTNLVESEPTGAGPKPDGAPRGQLVVFAQELDEASGRHVEFVAQTLAEIYAEATVSTLSRSAEGELELAEGQLPYEREKAMVLGTLALLSRGYTLEQAITALVLGTAIGEEESSCWFITDEEPHGRDLMEKECGEVSDFHLALADLFPSTETTTTTDEEVDVTPGSGLDGVYTGSLPPEWWTGDGDVVANEMEMTVEDDTIVSIAGLFRVEGFASETGAGDRVLCVSDLVQEVSSTAQAELSDGVAEVPINLFFSQSMGEPLTDEECDEDLAGEDTFPLTANVTVGDGAAVVQLLSEGQILIGVTLQP